MSVWTHVAAIARVDGFVHPNEKEELMEIFGRPVLWRSSDAEWREWEKNPEKFLPCGSEGSLDIVIWTNPNGHAMPRYVVSIFGDLRDYDDCSGVVDWFIKKVKEASESKRFFGVREATIVATDGRVMCSNSYDGDKWRIEEGI